MVIKEQIERAYQRLIKKDDHLLKVNANERSITHKLAQYIGEEFQDFDVDCEYNKNGLEVKRLVRFKREIDSDDDEGVTVYPDIIVHHRGTKNNFIVIEAKKKSNGSQHRKNYCKCDRCKLLVYKKELDYKYAYFVQFPVLDDFKNFKDEDIDQYIEEV